MHLLSKHASLRASHSPGTDLVRILYSIGRVSRFSEIEFETASNTTDDRAPVSAPYGHPCSDLYTSASAVIQGTIVFGSLNGNDCERIMVAIPEVGSTCQ